VVGESYRQEELRAVAERATSSVGFLAEVGGCARRVAEDQLDGRWFRAVLRSEPANPHDANAVAVDAEDAGQIGYLSRNDALAYAPVFDVLRTLGYELASCPAYVIGEERAQQSLGAMLCLSAPDEILRSLVDEPPAR
jgi:HIRAN domain